MNRAKNTYYDSQDDERDEKGMIAKIAKHGPFELLMANHEVNTSLNKIFMTSFGHEAMPRCAFLNMCFYSKRWHFVADENSPEIEDFQAASPGAVKAKAMPPTAKAKPLTPKPPSTPPPGVMRKMMELKAQMDELQESLTSPSSSTSSSTKRGIAPVAKASAKKQRGGD